jgi:type I restriction enzyme S subunit
MIPEYIYYMFKYRDWDVGTNKAVMGKTLNKATLSLVEVDICDIERQREIVEILDKVVAVIDGRTKELNKLDNLIKARFVEMFGDPITNSKELPREKMDKRYFLKAGITTSADDIHEYIEGKYEIPCYGGNGVRGYVEEFSYEGEYPIIGRQGALCGNVQYASEKFHATEHAVLVSMLKDDNTIWAYYMLSLMDLYRYHTGAAQPGLAVKNLNTVDVIVAEKKLQNQFAAFVAQVDKSKVAVQKSLEEVQLLFDSLMQEYFG